MVAAQFDAVPRVKRFLTFLRFIETVSKAALTIAMLAVGMLGLGQGLRRKLSGWADNTEEENIIYCAVSLFLVLFAGVASGLTLGLCSLDK